MLESSQIWIPEFLNNPKYIKAKGIFETLLLIQKRLSLPDYHFRCEKPLFIRESGSLKELHSFLNFDIHQEYFTIEEEKNKLIQFINNKFPSIIYKKDFLMELVKVIMVNNKEDFSQESLNKWLKDFNITKNLDASYKIEGVGSFRINVSFSLSTPMIVCRKIDDKSIPAKELWIPNSVLKWAWKENWLILFTGPTGAGKSTSLVSFVEYINQTYSKHIITIENPIEFYYKDKKSLITQKEVSAWRDVNSFSDWLKFALRQDPDIIMVWEMRDAETIELAIQAADTGHLVLATIHSTSSIKAIDRICDSFPANEADKFRAVLSNQLIWIVNQRLIKPKNWKYFTAYEVLNNDTAVSNIIKENNLNQIGIYLDQITRWNIPMDLALAEAVSKWFLSLSEAMLKSPTNNEKAFISKLHNYLNLNYAKNTKLIDEKLKEIELYDKEYKMNLEKERNNEV